MRFRTRISLVITAAWALGNFSGCGGEAVPSDRPATVPVKGIVRLKGAPVEGASVTLKNRNNGPGASGITNADGTFTLTTFTSGDGAVPGEYLVGVIKTEVVGADNSYFDVESPNYGKTPPKGAEGKVVHHIPQKYSDPDRSGLTANISESDPNLTIELSDD